MGPAGSLGAIARSLGQLATLLERWDDADRHFQDALDLNEKMGHRPALAQTRMNYGDMLVRRDGLAIARRPFPCCNKRWTRRRRWG